MLSSREKAHFPGNELLPQIAGWACRQPKVMVRESFSCKGSFALLFWVLIETPLPSQLRAGKNRSTIYYFRCLCRSTGLQLTVDYTFVS